MGGDDRLDDGQPENRAAAIDGIGLPETIENIARGSRLGRWTFRALDSILSR